MATHTVQQSGGDFSSLSAALSDAGTGAGDTISIEGTWTVDDTTVTAVVEDDNITIQTDSDSYHDGLYNESNNHYRLVGGSNGSHCIRVDNDGCTIDGIAIIQDSTGSSDECLRMNAGSNATLTVNRCIFSGPNESSNQDCVYADGIDATLTIENCIFYFSGRAGINIQWVNSTRDNFTFTLNVNSCTLWNHNSDNDNIGGGIILFVNSGADNNTFSLNIFNTIVLDVDTTEAYNEVDNGSGNTITWSIDNCIANDASITARDSGAVGALATRTATDSTSPGAGDWVMFNDTTGAGVGLIDLHLQDDVTNNDAQDAHSNTSGAGLNLPTLDIDDETRDTASGKVDIGADAFPAAGGANPKGPFGMPLHGPLGGPV